MKVRLLLIDPQNSYNPRNVTDIQRRHLFSGFNWQLYRGQMTEIHAFLSSNMVACFWKASSKIAIYLTKTPFKLSITQYFQREN